MSTISEAAKTDPYLNMSRSEIKRAVDACNRYRQLLVIAREILEERRDECRIGRDEFLLLCALRHIDKDAEV